MSKKKTSEFGKGFLYNLFLFAKHHAVHQQYLADAKRSGLKSNMTELWFNEASDHLYELEVPPAWEKKKIGKLAKEIQAKGLHFGHGFAGDATVKDFSSIYDQCEELMMLIDKELGVKPTKAEWN